jgi:hypothetical protein
MNSKGILRDTEGTSFSLVGSHVSPTRPSDRISMKMKIYEEDGIWNGDCWGLK